MHRLHAPMVQLARVNEPTLVIVLPRFFLTSFATEVEPLWGGDSGRLLGVILPGRSLREISVQCTYPAQIANFRKQRKHFQKLKRGPANHAERNPKRDVKWQTLLYIVSSAERKGSVCICSHTRRNPKARSPALSAGAPGGAAPHLLLLDREGPERGPERADAAEHCARPERGYDRGGEGLYAFGACAVFQRAVGCMKIFVKAL